MTDYKRMVSYMYQYESGVKKKNVGFVRIEAKDGQCKITLHMQLLGQLDSIFPTYLIQRNSGTMELVYIGDTILKNQIMDSRFSAREENIMDSGHSLAEMGGLLLFFNDNTFFATEWDDKAVILSEVLEAMKPKAKEEPELTLAQELLIPKYKLPRGYKILERMQLPPQAAAEVMATVGERKKEEKEDNPVLLKSDPEDSRAAVFGLDTQEPEDDFEGINSEENNSEKKSLEENSLNESGFEEGSIEENNIEYNIPEENIMRKDSLEGEALAAEQDENIQESAVAAGIFENNPRIYPFEDNEILVCAKIEPKDIGLLPKELWALSNNSFLMHGFYCYHHLIFAKLKDRYGCRYILGVPGIYHNRERFMAKMFGFESFKPIRKRELRQGDFGYWYLPVSL